MPPTGGTFADRCNGSGLQRLEQRWIALRLSGHSAALGRCRTRTELAALRRAAGPDFTAAAGWRASGDRLGVGGPVLIGPRHGTDRRQSLAMFEPSNAPARGAGRRTDTFGPRSKVGVTRLPPARPAVNAEQSAMFKDE